MGLQKETIVTKALEILNRDGLEGVTLRRVAAELQVKAASLYWHVQNKRELLDEMAEVMLRTRLSSYDPPDKSIPWQTWLVDIANRLRDALLAYRDGGLVVAGVNPNRAKTFARLGAFLLTTLHQTYGLELESAGILCTTVLLYTWASVIEEQTSPPMEEIVRKGPAIQQYLSEAMLQELSQLNRRPERTTTSFFNQGLQLIIAGAEKTWQERTQTL
ncbi:TetR family transcriptional regulator [Reticulibacter mediterranei]|uniref:TetR family transcriptional regulator n=1 Tax=Reticulibacter mediterranei TaxID=2778369 RepID=A0A8J3IW67_9CHLR|nr:TetR family transcriptional regulator [Reticulibacter mediterranei]